MKRIHTGFLILIYKIFKVVVVCVIENCTKRNPDKKQTLIIVIFFTNI